MFTILLSRLSVLLVVYLSSVRNTHTKTIIKIITLNCFQPASQQKSFRLLRLRSSIRSRSSSRSSSRYAFDRLTVRPPAPSSELSIAPPAPTEAAAELSAAIPIRSNHTLTPPLTLVGQSSVGIHYLKMSSFVVLCHVNYWRRKDSPQRPWWPNSEALYVRRVGGVC